jgi:hypothetical protein
MSISELVSSKRESLFNVMMATADRNLETPESAISQFIWGFINVLEASAHGDHGPRDLYLSSVIPALRDGSMPFSLVVASMVRVSSAAASVLGPEHLQWVSDYCADYTVRLMAHWEGSS